MIVEQPEVVKVVAVTLRWKCFAFIRLECERKPLAFDKTAVLAKRQRLYTCLTSRPDDEAD